MSKISFPPPPNESDDEGSITRVIRKMQKGDNNDANVLWERFYPRLKAMMRERLSLRASGMSDEEDVALESLAELFRGLANGQFSELDNRDSFWKLLVTVASRNVMDEYNRERRLKRGGGKVMNVTSLSRDEDTTLLFDKLASGQMAPDMQLMVAERCTELLEMLPSDEMRAIAIRRTTGSTNQEIADALGMSLRSVERRLETIREYWKGET